MVCSRWSGGRHGKITKTAVIFDQVSANTGKVHHEGWQEKNVCGLSSCLHSKELVATAGVW